MSLPFVKMHGCGNDFAVVRAADWDAALESSGLDAAGLVRRLCDRHRGLGADGVLAYAPLATSRLRMTYWNADGTRAEMCGNGARCVIRLAHDRAECTAPLVLETDAGSHAARVTATGGVATWVELAMGRPAWEPARVPVASERALVRTPLEVGEARFEVTALSMGNPHAVVFVRDAASLNELDLETLGRALAEHAVFPAGANASFAAVEGSALHLRVWERGVGPTLACGTAACAAVTAAARLQILPRVRTAVHLPGGTVEVWDEDGVVWLAGPAVRVAEGTVSTELWC